MRPERPEKLHYFKYRIDSQKEIKAMEMSQTNHKILDEELKVLINLGVKKQEKYTNYDNSFHFPITFVLHLVTTCYQ